MKFICMITFIISSAFFMSECSQNHNDIKSIVITIDPNKKENKYQVVEILDKDSIQSFMKKLHNRKNESVKFYPRFSIDINYNNRTENYLGNAKYLKDLEGHTYILLIENWEIYNY